MARPNPIPTGPAQPEPPGSDRRIRRNGFSLPALPLQPRTTGLTDPPGASLKYRLFLVALAALLAVSAAIVWQSRVIIFRTLDQELIERGVGIAQSIAERGTGAILNRDLTALTQVVFEEARVPSRRSLVDYVLVMDQERRVLAHTFVTPVPEPIRLANPLPPDRDWSVRQATEGDHQFFDVAVPVAGGLYRLGEVHVGLSKVHIESLRGRLRTTSIGFILAVSVLVFVVSFWLLDVINRRETALLMERNAIQRERLASLQQLSAAVAHQIRNPVMIIGGMAGLLDKRLPASDKCSAYVEAIQEAARRLEHVAQAAGELSRLRLGQVRTADLAQVAIEAKALAEAKAAQLGLSQPVAWRFETPPARIEADAPLLTQALAETMLNSLEALTRPERRDAPPTIQIRSRQERDRTIIVVEDNGPGVAEVDLPFLFDPFFTTKTVGAGLGLAKAKRIMEEHRGDVRIENLPEGGVAATLILPAVPHAGAPFAASEATTP